MFLIKQICMKCACSHFKQTLLQIDKLNSGMVVIVDSKKQNGGEWAMYQYQIGKLFA